MAAIKFVSKDYIQHYHHDNYIPKEIAYLIHSALVQWTSGVHCTENSGQY